MIEAGAVSKLMLDNTLARRLSFRITHSSLPPLNRLISFSAFSSQKTASSASLLLSSFP